MVATPVVYVVGLDMLGNASRLRERRREHDTYEPARTAGRDVPMEPKARGRPVLAGRMEDAATRGQDEAVDSERRKGGDGSGGEGWGRRR